MIVFRIGHVQKETNLTKKEIKAVLLRASVITDSWAIENGKGLVVELNDVKDSIIETTLLITEGGLELLTRVSEEIAEAKAWEATHG